MTGIHRTVIPAQAGIQPACVLRWIPACAGMTTVISGSMLTHLFCYDAVAGHRTKTHTAMLLFKKHFLPAIRQGVKTQTIRIWKHRRMRNGQRSYIPGAGYIRIETVERIALSELTEDDATRDGFSSLANLHAELERLYPEGLADARSAYRVRFSLLPPEEQKKQPQKKQPKH